MKKIIAIAMCLLLMLALPVPSFADDSDIMLCYENISVLNSSFKQTSITASSVSALMLTDSYQGEIIATIQRKDGTRWTDVKTFTTKSGNPVSINETWHVSSGHTYRCYFTYNVYDSENNIIETVYRTSSEVYFSRSFVT